ncbi:MAG: hypothetical protein ACI9H8_002497 [Lysobacterales bacterium]
MKTFFLVSAIILYGQPMQAGYCDMGTEQSPEQNTTVIDGLHGDLEGTGDCCNDETSQPSNDCDGAAHCGSCVVSATAVIELSRYIVDLQTGQPFALSIPGLAPSHSVPLYRPPIS